MTTEVVKWTTILEMEELDFLQVGDVLSMYQWLRLGNGHLQAPVLEHAEKSDQILGCLVVI